MEGFYKLLSERIEDATKILKAHRELLTQEVKDGLQPFMTRGWIDLNKMFSTIGLIALPETLDTMDNNKEEEMLKMLTFINDKVEEMTLKYHMPMNIEQVPAESMAVRLVKVDKMLYGETKVPYTLYSNQFIPLWQDATVFERMDMDGKYNKCFSGGGIVHFTLAEKTTSKQNYKLIKYAVKSGCEHFALNAIYSECENGHCNFGDLNVCPKCGAKIKSKLTRVVGFFTRVENWNDTRREWEFKRRKAKKIE